MKPFILFLGALCFSFTLYGQNLVSNGTFDGNPSYSSWTNAVSGVTNQQTGGNPGGCAWLNHSGGSSDPAISQQLSGLKVGETYVVKGDYVGGTNVHLHQRNVKANVFAIDIDGQAIKKMPLPKDMYKWTNFEATFVARDSSHELRFRSEIDGTDGDVKLDNISVSPVNGASTITPAAAKSTLAIGWFDNTSSTDFTLSNSYQYSSKAGKLTGKKISTGVYEVSIPNFGTAFNGVAHVTTYGGNHSAQIERWSRAGTDVTVRVRTFNPSGTAVDGRFSLLFYKEDQPGRNAAYLWASSEGQPTHQYKYNGKGNLSVKKTQTGIYQVRFSGIKADQNKEGSGGSVIATAYGTQALRAQVQSWLQSGNDLVATVRLTDAAGTPKDGRFSVSYIADWSNEAAYLWADNATTTAKYTPSPAYNMNSASASNNEITRSSTGRYAVSLPALPNTFSTAIATSYGTDGSYATVVNWTRDSATKGTTVNVQVYGPDGQPKDGRFSLLFTSNQ